MSPKITEISNIPPKTRVIFLSGRMQPPTKGHISFLRDLLSLKDDLSSIDLEDTPCNKMVLSLGWAPIDQSTQLEAILSKLKSCKLRPFMAKIDVEFSLKSIMNNINLSNKDIEDRINTFLHYFYGTKCNIPYFKNLIISIKKRIIDYRKVFVLPLTESIKEQIKNNPFSFYQRERIIRMQLSEEQNKKLIIAPALGGASANSILFDDKRYADRIIHPTLDFRPQLGRPSFSSTEYVYICSGEQYIDRATHVYTAKGCEQILDAKDPVVKISDIGNVHDYATSKGFNRILVVPRPDQDKISGTLTREIMMRVCSGISKIEDLYELMFNEEPLDELKSIILGDTDTNTTPIWKRGLLHTYAEILNTLK